MKMDKNLQAGLIVIAFILTVAILFAGKALTTKLKVDQPLAKEVKKIKVVEKFKVETVQNGITVNLKLRKVADLQVVLDEVKQKVQAYEHKPVREFEIISNPNQALKDIQYQLIFYLEEAAVSGRYTQLLKALDSFDGVSAKVYLSTDYVYIQLEKGSNYLYQAIPRIVKVTQNQNAVMGGESS